MRFVKLKIVYPGTKLMVHTWYRLLMCQYNPAAGLGGTWMSVYECSQYLRLAVFYAILHPMMTVYEIPPISKINDYKGLYQIIHIHKLRCIMLYGKSICFNCFSNALTWMFIVIIMSILTKQSGIVQSWFSLSSSVYSGLLFWNAPPTSMLL